MAVARFLGMSGTRDWIYPQSIEGSFTRLRRWTFLGLHLALFVAPWITLRGHPLVQFDLPQRLDIGDVLQGEGQKPAQRPQHAHGADHAGHLPVSQHLGHLPGLRDPQIARHGDRLKRGDTGQRQGRPQQRICLQ